MRMKQLATWQAEKSLRVMQQNFFPPKKLDFTGMICRNNHLLIYTAHFLLMEVQLQMKSPNNPYLCYHT